MDLKIIELFGGIGSCTEALIKPKYVIWENVKNVLSAKHKPNFDKYIQKMSDLGYENYYQVLNAKDYEIPQNRGRVFVVSILGGGAFKFPKKKPLNTTFRDFLQDNPSCKYYLSQEQHEARQKSGYVSTKKEFLTSDLINTETARQYKGGQYFKKNEVFRKLTPLECWRLMGFSDDSFFKARAINSDTQLYKQAGN